MKATLDLQSSDCARHAIYKQLSRSVPSFKSMAQRRLELEGPWPNRSSQNGFKQFPLPRSDESSIPFPDYALAQMFDPTAAPEHRKPKSKALSTYIREALAYHDLGVSFHQCLWSGNNDDTSVLMFSKLATDGEQIELTNNITEIIRRLPDREKRTRSLIQKGLLQEWPSQLLQRATFAAWELARAEGAVAEPLPYLGERARALPGDTSVRVA